MTLFQLLCFTNMLSTANSATDLQLSLHYMEWCVCHPLALRVQEEAELQVRWGRQGHWAARKRVCQWSPHLLPLQLSVATEEANPGHSFSCRRQQGSGFRPRGVGMHPGPFSCCQGQWVEEDPKCPAHGVPLGQSLTIFPLDFTSETLMVKVLLPLW